MPGTARAAEDHHSHACQPPVCSTSELLTPVNACVSGEQEQNEAILRNGHIFIA